MFSKNTSGGGSLFNNINTSTPTSTPTPATNSLQKPFKAGGQQTLFGNANSGASVSTPSPSVSILNNQTSGNGLFGGVQTQTGSTTGGLFGGSTTNKTNGQVLGQNTATSGGGGLFGRGDSTQSGTMMSGNKFNGGTSLFGSGQNTSGLASSNNTSVNSGLFGNQQSQGNSQANFSFNNSGLNSVTSQVSPNPYGLNVGNMPMSVSTMPASITASARKPTLDRSAGSTTSVTSGSATSGRRNFSISSATSSTIAPQAALPATSKSSLINKLSARLKTAPSRSSTQGIFSPTPEGQWGLQEQNTFGLRNKSDSRDSSSKQKDVLPSTGFTPLSLQRGSVADMRKLKIDPGRSVAKKMKLFTGESAVTKSVDGQNEDGKCNSVELMAKDNRTPNSTPSTYAAAKEKNVLDQNDDDDKNTEESTREKNAGYWCSPSPEQLLNLTKEQLSAVPNFLIGRKGYGSITFQYDVDLTAFARDFKTELFGKVVIFNPNKTVEVYPEELAKPPIGCGLNVPAIISLENVYPVDKKSKKELKSENNFNEVQILVRRLKSIRNMTFVSYNPFGGVWTFKVNHFSIWGLTNEEDAEIDEKEVSDAAASKTTPKDFHYPKVERSLAQSNQAQHIIPGTFGSQNDNFVNHQLAQRDLVNFSQASHADLDFESQQEDDFLVEEKPYEPDINESDFEGMIVEPAFKTSNNWVEQLNLAGSNLKSVFSETTNGPKSSSPADIELLFDEFNENLKQEKKAQEDRRLVNHSFAKFSPDSSLLVKAPNCKVGVQSKFVPTKSLRNPLFVDSLFTKHFNLCAIDERPTNKYPKVSSSQLQFRDVAELCDTSSPEYTLWSLCSVLFDAIKLNYDVKNSAVEEVLLKKQRHQQICSWIVEQIKDNIEAQLKTETDALEIIFLHLLKNDVSSACKMAIKSQNGHLAILLSSLGSNDPRIRDLAAGQLERWRSCGQRVSPSIARIYELLAGNGVKKELLNRHEKEAINWLSFLGANLFYGKIDELSLKELIASSIESFASGNSDINFTIFKLYSSHSPMEATFEELKNVASPLDYSLPWYIAQILRSAIPGMISDAISDELTFDYIGQLRLSQLHKEALFAASFFSDDSIAEQQIRSIVYHEISKLTSAASRDILQRLNIPMGLVQRAIALKHRYNGNHLAEAQSLIKAGGFDDAESVVVESVGPTLIINGTTKNDTDLATLQKLLSSFPISRMKRWSSGLGVYDNYVRLKLENNTDKQLLDSLLNGVSLLFEAHKQHRAVPVCCNIISKDVAAAVLGQNQEAKCDGFKDKLLGLPLGHPEKNYLESLLK